MTAVDQSRELNARRPTKGTDRVHRGADRAAGEENVVYDNKRSTIERHWQFRRAHDRQFGAFANIVAIHRDIDHAHVDVDVDRADFTNELRDASRDFDAAGLDSSEGNRFQIWIALDDFVRDPPQRAANS